MVCPCFDLHSFGGSSLPSVSWPLKFPLCELFVITCTGSHSNPVIPHREEAQESFLRGRADEQYIASGYDNLQRAVVGIW